MAKLWDKGYSINKEIEKFTVGKDYELDRELVESEVAGSVAHAKMLSKIGVLDKEEFKKLKAELKEIRALFKEGKFTIKPEEEDVHTAVEIHLTEKLGDLGKKIHTGRSRNDQVLTDLRLYTKGKLLDTEEATLKLAEALIIFAEKNKDVPMPGRTHTQLAMPSSVGLWAGAFTESLVDDLELLNGAYELNDQCPLGSAASYGTSVPIDRKMVSDLLGFKKVQNNALYANNSRGKMEAIVLAALSQVMADLSKMASDLILFSIPELGYFELPKEFCTGSSIMPNKKNPDVLELVRAKSNAVMAAYSNVMGIIKDLPSGYNRDFQETKRPLMESLGTTIMSLNVMSAVIKDLKVNENNCGTACVPEIYAADKAVALVQKGIPFREAYHTVAHQLDELGPEDSVANIRSKKHQGATGNLGLEKTANKIIAGKKAVSKERGAFEAALKQLFKE